MVFNSNPSLDCVIWYHLALKRSPEVTLCGQGEITGFFFKSPLRKWSWRRGKCITLYYHDASTHPTSRSLGIRWPRKVNFKIWPQIRSRKAWPSRTSCTSVNASRQGKQNTTFPPFQNIYLFSISISISIIYQLSINYLSLSIIELNYPSHFQLSISYLFLSLFKISIIIFGQKTYVIMTHYKRHKAVIPNVTPAPLSFQSQLR